MSVFHAKVTLQEKCTKFMRAFVDKIPRTEIWTDLVFDLWVYRNVDKNDFVMVEVHRVKV